MTGLTRGIAGTDDDVDVPVEQRDEPDEPLGGKPAQLAVPEVGNVRLLDTGPFVALLDRSERNHGQCVAFFRNFRGRLITTEPVLTEVVYLLGPAFSRQKPALDFILAGGAELVPMVPALLKHCARLMSKYSDVPMDYADATLVAVAEALGIRDVLTLDRRGFSVYRYASRGSFRIFPDK